MRPTSQGHRPARALWRFARACGDVSAVPRPSRADRRFDRHGGWQDGRAVARWPTSDHRRDQQATRQRQSEDLKAAPPGGPDEAARRGPRQRVLVEVAGRRKASTASGGLTIPLAARRVSWHACLESSLILITSPRPKKAGLFTSTSSVGSRREGDEGRRNETASPGLGATRPPALCPS